MVNSLSVLLLLKVNIIIYRVIKKIKLKKIFLFESLKRPYSRKQPQGPRVATTTDPQQEKKSYTIRTLFLFIGSEKFY